MTKYVIDLPDGTTSVVAKKSSFLNNETDVMRIPVSQLELYVEPNVAEKSTVEKRVIELPADLIAWLERMKSNLEIIDVYTLFNDVLDDNSRSYVSYQLNFNSEAEALNTLAEWVLGHVEFVPKKEPRFIINVDSPTGIGRAEKDDNGNVRIEYYEFDVDTRSFTEAEADELVAGLTALNARKVKVED